MASARTFALNYPPPRWKGYEDAQASLLAAVRALVAEREQAQRERDLAVAHDRQPYPTAWAYEQATAALAQQRAWAEALRAALREYAEVLRQRGLRGELSATEVAANEITRRVLAEETSR